MIEALRLGIVPRDCACQFTFGREAEARAISGWLEGGKGVLLLEGGYGAGKTHLLDFAYGTALSDGYAVARVQVNPNETPFSKPKRVYGQLVANLRYLMPGNGETGNFAGLLHAIVGSGGLRDHEFFKHLAGKEDVALWEWIAAREPSPYPFDKYSTTPYSWYLPGMYDYGTAVNIYTYLLSGLSRAAKDVLGLKGLLLLFDESESITQYTYRYELDKSFYYIQALTLMANNDRKLCRFPKVRSDLAYCGVGPLHPYVYKAPTHVKIVFAMTPATGPLWLRGESGVESLELNPLDSVPRSMIRQGIVDLYDRAYHGGSQGGSPRLEFPPDLEELQTRKFVKGCVEALDLARNGCHAG